MPALKQQPGWLKSNACTQAQMDTPDFRRWMAQLKMAPRYHRKLWEFCYILQALHERGMLSPGKRGLGFAVGKEPLSSVFASFGCDVVATDLDPAADVHSHWVSTNQNAASLADLYHADLCPREAFDRHVTYRPADMTAIPADLTGFDFVWSSCSFEHLGSIINGRKFIRDMARCLKPGGVAVHTTEFNVLSDRDTLDNHPGTVIFRKRDMKAMADDLRRMGHEVAPFDFFTGDGEHDRAVDKPPFREDIHLKLEMGGFVATSIGLIVHTGDAPPPRSPLASVLAKLFAGIGRRSGV